MMSILLLCVAGACAKPLVDRMATHRSAIGFSQQKAGYQYYTRVALPDALETELGAAYASGTELSGSLFDEARKDAYAYCEMLHNRLQADVPDKCTSIAFSPFVMSCELKLIVTVECASRRNVKNAERYNALMSELLTLRVYEEARTWLIAYDDSKRKSERMHILLDASP